MSIKVQVKKLIGNKWIKVEMEDLKDKSIAEFIRLSKEDVVACIYQNDVPLAFLSNSVDMAESYKEKGLSMHIDHLVDLLGTEVAPSLIAKTFAGSDLAEIEVDSKELKK